MPFDDKNYYSVSEINQEIRGLLEEGYPDVAVLGEVSNFKRHTSGHLYFTLKDADSQLRTVCFRREAKNVTTDVADGMQVLVTGRLTLYEAWGQYQLVASAIEETGMGKLELAFRELCDKLEKEGLFDETEKQALPAYPFHIAVVTSPTGAAIRDIVSTLKRRWPCTRISLYPVQVQGEQAAPDIVHALQRLSEYDDIDVIIVGRGGGSLEDLWAFNKEEVARAIYDCPIPIISAVGHETDFTIADFVADVRAATPTMAAEIAVPRIDEVTDALERYIGRLVQHLRRHLQLKQSRLQELLRSYALGQVRGRIERQIQRHDFLMEKLYQTVRSLVQTRAMVLKETQARLKGLDARAVLARGFALCADYKTGLIIRSASAAVAASQMRVTFSDGSVLSEVKEKVHER